MFLLKKISVKKKDPSFPLFLAAALLLLFSPFSLTYAHFSNRSSVPKLTEATPPLSGTLSGGQQTRSVPQQDLLSLMDREDYLLSEYDHGRFSFFEDSQPSTPDDILEEFLEQEVIQIDRCLSEQEIDFIMTPKNGLITNLYRRVMGTPDRFPRELRNLIRRYIQEALPKRFVGTEERLSCFNKRTNHLYQIDWGCSMSLKRSVGRVSIYYNDLKWGTSPYHPYTQRDNRKIRKEWKREEPENASLFLYGLYLFSKKKKKQTAIFSSQYFLIE